VEIALRTAREIAAYSKTPLFDCDGETKGKKAVETGDTKKIHCAIHKIVMNKTKSKRTIGKYREC
jgi:hypothetical protein